jgi:hypothetical protein
MDVAALVREFLTLRRLLDREEAPGAALVDRRDVLREALVLGQTRPSKSDPGGRAVLVRLHVEAGVVELGAVLATDRELVLALGEVLAVDTEKVLLVDLGEGLRRRPGGTEPVLAFRAQVCHSEAGLCRFDISGLSRSDRLALLEAVAVDVAGSGLGPLRPSSAKTLRPAEAEAENESAWPDLDDDGTEPGPMGSGRYVA